MFFLVIYLALLNFTYAQNVGDRRTNPVVFTNESFFYEKYSNFVRITGYTRGGNVNVPEKIENLPVTSIAENSFNPLFVKNVIVQEYTQNFPYNDGGEDPPPSYFTWEGVLCLSNTNSAEPINNITIPPTVVLIENGAFTGCANLNEITLPSRFAADGGRFGFPGETASSYLIQSVANALATNNKFISKLAQEILAASNNFGLATQSGVSNIVTATTSNLATKAELTASLSQSRADGINSVLSNPNLWTLYTTNQIKNMAIGDLVLSKQVNGQFVLNYDIEQSEDMQTWTPYLSYALPMTNLPTDKAFVRIKAK